MLFNSHVFLFAFLPIAFSGYWLLANGRSGQWARLWALLASLFFFAWWNPSDLFVLSGSLVGNYVVGRMLFGRPARSARWLLAIGVAGNLLLLSYFKYTKLIIATFDWLVGGSFSIGEIVLPLAISFFTFNQIAYLVDCHVGDGAHYAFVDYCLFITFFPHLIAGPIVHHREMVPQLIAIRRCDPLLVAQGITLFVLGLGKKVLFADNVAAYAKPIFDGAHLGAEPTLLDAWLGALAYTSQLYFDFSGYCDMAVGLGMMFGIIFPLNFASPYQARSIAEFWRRWHMTLSRFLRDYLYIPLGGNRRGRTRTSINLMITMLLGGLWHGAAWTFLAWGGLHGLYLLIHQRFRTILERRSIGRWVGCGMVCWGATFMCVVFGWVLFRAESFDSAMRIWGGMLGVNGIALSARHFTALQQIGLDPSAVGIFAGSLIVNPSMNVLALILGLVAIAAVLPNSQEIIGIASSAGARSVSPVAEWMRRLQWQPSLPWALVTACIAVTAVLHLTRVSEFLYFRF
jgi:D-alanyl-lipoteichoic acid acyltransferase DltB (MBOAT superfamily)